MRKKSIKMRDYFNFFIFILFFSRHKISFRLPEYFLFSSRMTLKATLPILALILHGIFAETYQTRENKLLNEDNDVFDTFKARLEKSTMAKNDIQLLSFIMTLFNKVAVNLEKHEGHVGFRNSLFRGSRV